METCFPDPLSSLWLCIGVFAFEEAVSSSGLYGLTSISGAFCLWVGYAGICCAPCSSGVGHLVQGHVVAPGLIGYDASLAEDAVERSINN